MPEAAERGSNFFLGFLLLPKAKREALSAIYAYCRLIDDIVDSGHLEKDEARRMLDFWRDEIGRLYAGAPTHSVSAALQKPLSIFSLPQEPFLEMIRGCEMDLAPAPYETFEQLESYMKGVACSVGRLSVQIFGYQHTSGEKIRQFADLFGCALQMTNIIRDVGADLEMGRVYLPASEMRQAGYSLEALRLRDHNPAFDRLMEGLYNRTRSYYQRGRNALDFRDRPAMLPAEIMAHVYEGVLEEMRRTGFRVLFRRTTIPSWRKAVMAFKAWLYCYGVHV